MVLVWFHANHTHTGYQDLNFGGLRSDFKERSVPLTITSNKFQVSA